MRPMPISKVRRPAYSTRCQLTVESRVDVIHPDQQSQSRTAHTSPALAVTPRRAFVGVPLTFAMTDSRFLLPWMPEVKSGVLLPAAV